MKSWARVVGLDSEMSFMRLFISILHIHEFPDDDGKKKIRGAVLVLCVCCSVWL